jgi:hypothetical protein
MAIAKAMVWTTANQLLPSAWKDDTLATPLPVGCGMHAHQLSPAQHTTTNAVE